MHQFWLVGYDEEENPYYIPTATRNTSLPKDSHFVFDTGDLLSVTAPNEDNDLAGTPDGHGGGTWLQGVFALKAAIQAQDLVVAKIVLAAGQQVTLTGTASNGVGDQFPVSVTIPAE